VPKTSYKDPLFDVSGQVVVITGACGLIGKVVAEAFHARGSKLVLTDIGNAQPEHYAASLGDDTIGHACDVSKASDVADLVNDTINSFKRVDVLINCHQFKPKGFLEAKAESFPEELWDAVIGVNLTGTFLTCRDFGRVMLEQGKGSIVNFASTYGVVSSNPDLYEGNSLGNPLAYSVSKAGVIMLTKYLGAYWAARGVRVNCVSPHGVSNNHESGFIDKFSAKSPMRRLMQANDIIGAVLFLASDASSYATGSNVLVEGGWTIW
jgi:NAD(P)-dependent dehydrogenase (short-subunit alcohol dehydrogenase family)